MATLNVSDKQKQRVIETVKEVSKVLGTSLSQSTIVDMGMAALEDKYKLNTKSVDTVLK
jgi:Mor family transcriptional regulator